jgi:hypothetical protein
LRQHKADEGGLIESRKINLSGAIGDHLPVLGIKKNTLPQPFLLPLRHQAADQNTDQVHVATKQQPSGKSS